MRKLIKLTSAMLSVILITDVASTTTMATSVNPMSTALPSSEATSSPTTKPTAKPTVKPTKKPKKKINYKNKYMNVGMGYAAKGQTITIKDWQKGKIKMISAAGNKYRISGNKIKITCKKSGWIKYQSNGQKKYYVLAAGGNGKDKKLNKKEYNMSYSWKGKKYKNYIDAFRDNKNYSFEIVFKGKDKADAKYNRNVIVGNEYLKIIKKYPSWEDFEGETHACAARLYDIKSKRCFVKVFYFNKKGKINKIVWTSYKPGNAIYKTHKSDNYL